MSSEVSHFAISSITRDPWIPHSTFAKSLADKPVEDSFRTTTKILHRRVIRNIAPSVQRKSESLHAKIIEVRELLSNTPVLSREELSAFQCDLQKKNQDLQKFTQALEKYQAFKAEGYGWIRRAWNRNHDPERFGLTQADADSWIKGSTGTHSSYLSDKIKELTASCQAISQKIKEDDHQRQEIQSHLNILGELEKNILTDELKPLSGQTEERIAEITHRLGQLGLKRSTLTFECAPKLYADQLFGLLNDIRNNIEKAQEDLNLINLLLRRTGGALDRLDPYDFEFEFKYTDFLETLTPVHGEAPLLIAEKIRLSDQLDKKKLANQDIQTLRNKIRKAEALEIQKLSEIQDYQAVSNRPEISKIVAEYQFDIEKLFKRPPADTEEKLAMLKAVHFFDFEAQVTAAKHRLDQETGKALAHRIYLEPDKSLTESQMAQIDSGSDIFLDAMGDMLEEDLGKDSNFRTEDLLKKIGAVEDRNGNFTCTICLYDRGIKYYPGPSFFINAHQAELLRDFLEARVKDLIGGSSLYLEAKKDLEQITLNRSIEQ
jgi:hypothetical protein